MSKEDQGIIETGIFKTVEAILLDTALSSITDQEDARRIMGRFRGYITVEKSGIVSQDELQKIAQEIVAYVRQVISS